MKYRSRRSRFGTSPAARRIAAAAVLLATGALTVTFVSSGGKGAASAETSLQDFVRIQDVAANVRTPKPQQNASTGGFTVDCGTNGNGKFSPDNPVAQPGIKNGAEHLHDFVGNLAITADTSDQALAASGTTCKNGDRSSYFWPVVRIDKSVRPDAATWAGTLATTVATMACPSVRDRLPAVPARAMTEVAAQLRTIDRLTAQANTRIEAKRGKVDARFNESVTGPLRARRAAALNRIMNALAAGGRRPTGLASLADCQVSYDGLHAGHGATAPAASSDTPDAAAGQTVQCPAVRDKLAGVPDQAVDRVNRALAALDSQLADANERLVNARVNGADPAVDGILQALKAKRAATLDGIANAIGRSAARPTGLKALAPCRLSDGAQVGGSPDAGSQNAGAQGDNAQGDNAQGGDAQGGDAQGGDAQGGASPAPPAGGAAAALPDPSGPNLELPGNTGGIVQPASVLIEYRGNPTSKVTPMPKFLRELTGDAKPTSRGPANARATWTCSGFADRLSAKYPICPSGSQVMRVEDFPGCWDGKNIDSADHRAQVAFADPNTGACPQNFVAIPQLRISISYDIPRSVQQKGQFALDSFPEENHNPFSDHNDFVNVNSNRQMAAIAACINDGRRCS